MTAKICYEWKKKITGSRGDLHIAFWQLSELGVNS